MVRQLTISFHKNTYIVFLRDVISSQNPMKKEKFVPAVTVKKKKTKKQKKTKN